MELDNTSEGKQTLDCSPATLVDRRLSITRVAMTKPTSCEVTWEDQRNQL